MPTCIFCGLHIDQFNQKRNFCRTIHPECLRPLRLVKKVDRRSRIRSLSQTYDIESLSIERIELIIKSCHN